MVRTHASLLPSDSIVQVRMETRNFQAAVGVCIIQQVYACLFDIRDPGSVEEVRNHNTSGIHLSCSLYSLELALHRHFSHDVSDHDSSS